MFSENIYHQKPTLQPPLWDQGGLHAPKHNITASDEHAAVQAVVAIMDGDICVKSDPKTHGSLELFMFLRLTGPPKCPYIQENVLIFKSLVLTQNTFKNSITTSLNE